MIPSNCFAVKNDSSLFDMNFFIDGDTCIHCCWCGFVFCLYYSVIVWSSYLTLLWWEPTSNFKRPHIFFFCAYQLKNMLWWNLLKSPGLLFQISFSSNFTMIIGFSVKQTEPCLYCWMFHAGWCPLLLKFWIPRSKTSWRCWSLGWGVFYCKGETRTERC